MFFKSLLKADKRASLVSVPFLMSVMGALAFVFPIVMWLIHLYCDKEIMPLGSISEYYYTDAHDFFVGFLFVIGIFLVAYTGFAKLDKYLSTIAGIAAMGVAVIPTGCAEPYGYCKILCGNMCNVKATEHFICAGVFLVILMIFCFGIFTQNDKGVYWRKTWFFRTYFASGCLMAISLLGIGFYKWMKFPVGHEAHILRPIFIFETIALWAFGVSWIVKSSWLRKHLLSLKQESNN